VIPIEGEVTRAFDPPEDNWLPGHRGVDLLGEDHAIVAAAMDGVVVFASMLATRPVISIRHLDLTTTYEPVEALVKVGDAVVAGQPIGYLVTGHPCPGSACLHWGLKQGDVYLDPMSLVTRAKVRLLAAKDVEQARERAAQLRLTTGSSSEAGLVTPATGEVSSTFGQRVHPIDGVQRFHDGLDIAAACGTPILAAASGTVTESVYSSGYGNRLVIDHGVIAAHALTTAYNHAAGYVVGVGDPVQQGQVVGWVGTTGASTGCHLHFQVWVDQTLTDPQGLLP
jgi:murein DD-endopeptidase MepM/ murein hydrolase activator NlpD